MISTGFPGDSDPNAECPVCSSCGEDLVYSSGALVCGSKWCNEEEVQDPGEEPGEFDFIFELIDQRINAAVCNKKDELHRALSELKEALVTEIQKGIK